MRASAGIRLGLSHIIVTKVPHLSQVGLHLMVGERFGMDWKQLKELIELVSEKGFSEFEIERQGFRLKITQVAKGSTVPLVQMALPASSTSPSGAVYSGATEAALPASSAAQGVAADRGQKADVADLSLHIIKSPIVGTFYRSPSPTSEPFVKVGDRIEPDAVVCIIEAMKLMNEIQAETSGIIAEIYVENGQPVEYNQPLFGVRS